MLDKVLRKSEYFLRDLSFLTGLKKHSFSYFRRILVYHGVDEIHNTEINSRFISRLEFEKHLKFFSAHFNVLSLEEYFDGRASNDKPSICITFDDGYANNFEFAFPLLKRYNLPATFFVTALQPSGMEMLWADAIDIATLVYRKPITIDGECFEVSRKGSYRSSKNGSVLKERLRNSDLNFKRLFYNALPLEDFKSRSELIVYWKLMNEEQIRSLAESPLMTVGAHGYYHNCLDKVPIEDAEWELQKSKDWLEMVIQKPVKALAFPDGSFSDQLITSAKRLGFTQLLSTNFHMETCKETHELKERMTINPHISFNNQIHAIIKGRY
jgi:peptidoglycan/xylan/chitin deacetylase (PgdA/CDA1 family)